MRLLKLLIIIILFWNLPFLLYRIYKSRKLQKWFKPKFPTRKPSTKGLGRLPSEVLLKILLYCGILEIYRIGSCSKSLFQLTRDEILWEKKFYWDFHSKLAFRKLDLNYKNLYKSRYLLTESIADRDLRLGLKGILDSEFHLGLVRTWHLLLIPLKVFGFLSLPLFYILQQTRPRLSPSISSTRFFMHDLVMYATKCLDFTTYHLLFLLNIFSMILIISDGLACIFYVFSWILFELHQRISGKSQILVSLVFIFVQILIFLIPYIVYLSQNLGNSTLLMIYFLWIPTLVSFSEFNTLLFFSTSLGPYCKSWAFLCQCVFGIEAYFIFLGVSVIQGIGEYGS